MRNKNFIIFLFFPLFLISCNVPTRSASSPQAGNSTGHDFLWDLSVSSDTPTCSFSPQQHQDQPTATPQLVRAVSIDEAFSHSQVFFAQNQNSGTDDSAQWLYFSPYDYSTEQTDILYIGFSNTGSQTWNSDYTLRFYNGSNPSDKERISLNASVSPGNEAVFQIPIVRQDENWKACWQFTAPNGSILSDLCYNHGNGINASASASSSAQVQTDTSSGSDGGVFYAFRKTNGSAPAKYSDDELSAEFLSTSPEEDHIFPAYDHYESLTASFRNNGNAVWDSSYSLVFYSGYNWMHADSFPLSGTVDPGENAVITMPMEIFEDNDTWFTCWYLASPGGQNLADFCFSYYTRS